MSDQLIREQFALLNEECTALIRENRELRARNNELRDQLAKYKYDTWNLKILRAKNKQTHAA